MLTNSYFNNFKVGFHIINLEHVVADVFICAGGVTSGDIVAEF